MSKEVEVYLRGEHAPVKLFKVMDEALFKELCEKANIQPAASEKMFFFLEDEDVEIDETAVIKHHNVRHRHHIHCHRCRKIHVAISYNDRTVDVQVSPSTTIRKLLKLAIKELRVEGATFKLTIAGTSTELKPEDHIGSFAKFPACKVALNLVAEVLVQG